MSTEERPDISRLRYPRWVKVLSVVIFCVVVSGGVCLALEPYVTLHWALSHPKSYARFDPHHWLVRLALLSIAVSMVEAAWRGQRQLWRQFRAWQKTYHPLPWERHTQPAEAEPEPPAV